MSTSHIDFGRGGRAKALAVQRRTATGSVVRTMETWIHPYPNWNPGSLWPAVTDEKLTVRASPFGPSAGQMPVQPRKAQNRWIVSGSN
ncbi:hypothetical protein MPLA_1860010 [Mesorhizobium sp. ORS 3359]|nr:hypothetical protein MPLA_1860010 [Mesorhizobium sp. ORS 3359]